MTREYQIRFEVSPVKDIDTATTVVGRIRQCGAEICDDDYVLSDGDSQLTMDGHISLVSGKSPQEIHRDMQDLLPDDLKLVSRWLDLDPQRWDYEFGIEDSLPAKT